MNFRASVEMVAMLWFFAEISQQRYVRGELVSCELAGVRLTWNRDFTEIRVDADLFSPHPQLNHANTPQTRRNGLLLIIKTGQIKTGL